ncbi:MAG: hypothetical protein DMG11_34020 [Acidobacteria bacterium]|nr:MAG: hypothetical protein DMG11_34020 [Acidobacteriota bacterium]
MTASGIQTALLMMCGAAALVAQAPSAEPENFLRKELAITTGELASLEKGQIIVRLPKTPETREVAAFAIMRLDVADGFFIDQMRDIVNFKKSESVLQIGKFSNPPRLEDLAGLSLDAGDIEAIRRCKVNSCDVKLSERFIERFRKDVNWSAPNYRDRVTALTREMLLECVETYLLGGNTALGEYRDKPYPLRLADEFRSLLQPVPYMYEYAPEFQQYLLGFPDARPADVEDFIYWSKEKLGLKPVISLTHVTIYRQHRPNGTDLLIASKGIYANHYLEVSLGLTGFIHSQSSDPDRTYLIYVNRSRADALRGLFGGLKRSLVLGSLRDGVKKNMEMIKDKLESDYWKYENKATELQLNRNR